MSINNLSKVTIEPCSQQFGEYQRTAPCKHRCTFSFMDDRTIQLDIPGADLDRFFRFVPHNRVSAKDTAHVGGECMVKYKIQPNRADAEIVVSAIYRACVNQQDSVRLAVASVGR